MLKENTWSRRAVEAENRFEFGRNWQRFLRDLDEKRVQAAEMSLREMLGFNTLAGQSFLDVGSGSGLFSLAARRLGAKVHSFDYDLESVACTRGLKTSFFPSDEDWRVERGSALDREYLRGLGSSDIVYSWGVLHHTGAMWNALENMQRLVKHGGKLFIAIYNDQGKMSDLWRFIKKIYVMTPRAFQFLILWPIALFFVAGMTMSDIYHLRRPRIISGSSSPRGMSVWTDIVDWVGGYPFEVAAPGQIADFFQRRGFRLDRQVTCGRKLGCNQFVFTKCEREQTGNERCGADSQRPPANRKS